MRHAKSAARTHFSLRAALLVTAVEWRMVRVFVSLVHLLLHVDLLAHGLLLALSLLPLDLTLRQSLEAVRPRLTALHQEAHTHLALKESAK